MTERKKTAFAKHLRRNQSNAESLVWSELRGRKCGGYKFRRQVPIGKYVVDFLCTAQKLIVEIDGPSHEAALDYDTNRTRVLEAMGYIVMRLNNDDIYDDLDASIEASECIGKCKALEVASEREVLCPHLITNVWC